MSDILIRNMPADLKRQIEDRARRGRHSLSREIQLLLERALAQTTRPEGKQLVGGLGTRLAGLIKEEDWDDAFIQPRDNTEREPPTFE
jgi:plasmid stability protein